MLLDEIDQVAYRIRKNSRGVSEFALDRTDKGNPLGTFFVDGEFMAT